MLLPLAVAPEGGIVQGGAGGSRGNHRHAAKQPEQAQKNAVCNLGHGDHQRIFRVEQFLKHMGRLRV